MTQEQKRIAELEAKIALLESQNAAKVTMRVSDQGYVEVFGVPGKGRFSISMTPDGWEKIFEIKAQIMSFVDSNRTACKARLDAYRNGKQAKANVG